MVVVVVVIILVLVLVLVLVPVPVALVVVVVAAAATIITIIVVVRIATTATITITAFNERCFYSKHAQHTFLQGGVNSATRSLPRNCSDRDCVPVCVSGCLGHRLSSLETSRMAFCYNCSELRETDRPHIPSMCRLQENLRHCSSGQAP